MSNKIVSARQGDVFIRGLGVGYLGFPLNGLWSPTRGRGATKKSSNVVLAEGEATGHAHVLESLDASKEVEFIGGSDGRLYLRVTGESGARVTHQEHGAVELPAGDYVVTTQREYDPAEATRAMID